VPVFLTFLNARHSQEGAYNRVFAPGIIRPLQAPVFRGIQTSEDFSAHLYIAVPHTPGLDPTLDVILSTVLEE